ncbi:hypothetical protein CPC08DRAFT_726718 [Agrocybe pediades]|nr:hypothetical protein CPC08DRAFT_726718 [Agrocybe pediades]
MSDEPMGHGYGTQIRLMPQLQDLVHNSDAILHAESLPLFLPSNFDATERQKLNLGQAAAVEYKLREGQANEAVEGICHSILHHRVVLDTKNEHARDSLEDFPELLDEHMYGKNAASARNLGDGKRTESWLWTFSALKGLDDKGKAEFVLEVQWRLLVEMLPQSRKSNGFELERTWRDR